MSDNNNTHAVAVRTVAGLTFTPNDAANARRWHNANADAPAGRGRLAGATLVAWHEAGRPALDAPPTVVATVEYRKLDATGRVNGPTLTVDALHENLPRRGSGRPATVDYITAAGLTVDAHRVSRIITAAGALHTVAVNDDLDGWDIVWESKADQRAVIVALLRTIAERDATIASLTDGDDA